MCTWSSGGLWIIRVRGGRVRLSLPFPMYVLTDLLESADDLCEVILPRLGITNPIRAAEEFIEAIITTDPEQPLLRIQANGWYVECGRIN